MVHKVKVDRGSLELLELQKELQTMQKNESMKLQ
jgi:hypothetical protein